MPGSIAIRIGRTLSCATFALAAASGLAQTAPAQPLYPFAPSQPIPGRYIVVLKSQVTNPAATAAALVAAAGPGAQLHHSYRNTIKGFAATLPDVAVQALQRNPVVDFVEQDQTVSLVTTQNNATWGLDRIDQADRPLSGTYDYLSTGEGVHAFIIDTGILSSHVEFGTRVLPGYTAIADGRGTEDCNGHGTHVAGTVGGTTWGVAKAVSLVPVRVLNCRGSGTWSGVIAGVDWVAASPLRPAVANMSLGGGYSASVNSAVAGAATKGVTTVVAAGNSDADACSYSPASEASAITVGATTAADARSSYSNWGTCLDLFAPGSSITSAWNTSPTATNTISGTSMASPHVAGAAALVLQGNQTASPAAISDFLVKYASAGKVSSPGTGSPNGLVYSLASGPVTEPAMQDIAVQSIAGSSNRKGKNWRAYATVIMRNLATGAVMPSVTVSGAFDAGGSASCVTGSNGSCTLSSGPISSEAQQTRFSVTGASGYRMTYSADQNAFTQITINKP
jgi:subtilisin family serine protease